MDRETDQAVQRLQTIVDKGRRIVFFGGAGVSTESGIPDFRSIDGLYAQEWKYPPEEIISDIFFSLNTKEFYRFYRAKMLFPDAKPNPAHSKLYEMEKAGKLGGIVTQNIDGLHRKAGNLLVFELHGTVYENTCVQCGKKYGLDAILNGEDIPRCTCGGVIKPDVVLYGEPLDDAVVRGALRAISQADVLIVAGTSLKVWPAADYIRNFSGRELVVINREPITADRGASLVIRGSVGEIFSKLTIQ